jgi:hypothetical protein
LRKFGSFKVIVFSWQAFHGRLPTGANLAIRGIIQEGEASSCGSYVEMLETKNHLFILCRTAWRVWAKIHRWFGVTMVLPCTILSLFDTFLAIFRMGKQDYHGVLLVWHAIIWMLWLVRNGLVFVRKVIEPDEIFEKIKLVSWKWLLQKRLVLLVYFMNMMY